VPAALFKIRRRQPIRLSFRAGSATTALSWIDRDAGRLSAFSSVSEANTPLYGLLRHPKGTRAPKQSGKVNSTKENT